MAGVSLGEGVTVVTRSAAEGMRLIPEPGRYCSEDEDEEEAESEE
jgi:hypothetical protein